MLELSALHTVVIRLQKLNWTTQPITAQSYKNKLTLSSLEIWGGNWTSCFKLTQRLVFQLDYKRLSDRFLHFRDLRRKHKQYVGVIRSYPVGFFSISEVLINKKEQQDTKQCRGFFEALREWTWLFTGVTVNRRAINTHQCALHPPLPPTESPTGHIKNSPFNASSLGYKYTTLGVWLSVCQDGVISKSWYTCSHERNHGNREHGNIGLSSNICFWDKFQKVLPATSGSLKIRNTPLRKIFDGIKYVFSNGCPFPIYISLKGALQIYPTKSQSCTVIWRIKYTLFQFYEFMYQEIDLNKNLLAHHSSWSHI